MNLFDVKNAIETIVRLNPGITEERLIVLLQAANWDHAHIDEGVMLFRESAPELPSGEVGEDHLLESSYQEEIKSAKQEQQIPSDLPLKPFDTSPQVLTFSTYKEIFHGEKVSEAEKIPPGQQIHKDELVHIPYTGVIPRRYVFDPTEPLTGTDISLTFIVTLLLLTILLLIGYMYTNGRLFID